jgi:hypothetical protein
MEGDRKYRKRDRLIALFKSRETPSQPPSTLSQTSHEFPPNVEQWGDQQRAKIRYEEAAKPLQETVGRHGNKWGSFDFSGLIGEPEDSDVSKFKDKINTALKLRKDNVKDQTAWGKCLRIITCILTAMTPLAKRFLEFAKDSSVLPSYFAFHS